MAAANALTCSASTLVSKTMGSKSPLPVGLGQSPVLAQTLSSKGSSSRPSLVVKAQGGGGPNRIDPVAAGQFHKKVALIDTSPYVRTPWNTTEDESEIKMWFDMPGMGAENIEVEVVDDLLVIKGSGGLDAYGNKVFSPHETTLQLPFNAWKEEIVAVFKNGVLYITVPKILKFEHKIIYVPVRAV